ncbi:hypothetical protein GCM10010912_10350 [Paenibacillus albidus]|uniref:Uncharacterized protein n=1 Tax=Paenibacillus albidus TaxID=2041023 RepID=A0A917C475_9BACL|nr:hypothetical protein GCM10010912_10350 [Paenibacillus albidus]
MAHSKATSREARCKPRAEIARVHFIHQDGKKEGSFYDFSVFGAAGTAAIRRKVPYYYYLNVQNTS